MCDMAVVVQVQVNGRVSGVAFTRDPISGDPEKITIAATHGTGEVSLRVFPIVIDFPCRRSMMSFTYCSVISITQGVVSGSVEPDTVVMSRMQLLMATMVDDDSNITTRDPTPGKHTNDAFNSVTSFKMFFPCL